MENSIQLKAKIYPEDATNKNILWKSSNTDVAIVNENGLVVSVGYGHSTITATSEDGNKIARCEVNVTEDIYIVKGIVFEDTVAIIEKGIEYQIAHSIFPSTAINKNIHWESSNTDIAIVDGNGSVLGKKTGECVIKATTDDSGKTAK
ncbi:Ig-like domain-containing protein, partial [Romboutsia sp.]|uniref:Ig-like domain-containing protein n=1 Tax=Romboutsia sp. TaxID=1965302 RepID=UPI003F2A3418